MASARGAGGLILLAAALVSVSLQGCNPKPSPSPSPTPSPSPSPSPPPSPSPSPPPSPSEWRLAPIEIRGQHLYDSVTKKQFHAKGIGMPNVGEDVQEWIKVLQRIHELSPEVNMVRIYVPPTCAFEGLCFKPFMKEADKLGIYVLVPGTGTQWGWLPGTASACKPETPEGCYKAGGVLGFGQKVVQHFNYPNTLAIIIGNEFDMQMLKFIPLLKAYARDLKAYMEMCDTDKDSPTRGQMRKIPLMYASSDDRGDAGVRPKAEYLFCDSRNSSVDIFGLNVERWCEDKTGRGEYNKINKWVGDGKYPGAFLFSEMGCTQTGLPTSYNKSRTWNQVQDFFTNFPAMDGFVAYTYYGNKDFNMFSSEESDAQINQDGKNFFERLNHTGEEPQSEPTEDAVAPECPETILGIEIGSYHDVKAYTTGPTGWAPSCPKPYDSKNLTSESVADAEILQF